MKKVILKSLTIISPPLKKAKIVEFDEHITIITSENRDGQSQNHTGKSLLMKSIYHAFGAKLTKYTKNWKSLGIVTMISFLYKDKEYSIFRYGDNFILSSDSEEKVFLSVAELKEFYKIFFDFGLELTLVRETENLQLHTPYPSAYFLPFYIDQDMGWTGQWKSFSDLSMYDHYLLNIMKYHTGVTDNEYYMNLLNQNKYRQEKLLCEEEIKKCNIAIEQGKKYFGDILDINVDISEFEKELNNLTMELNKIQNKKNNLKQKLLKIQNKKIEIAEKKNNISNILSDLKKDKAFIDKNLSRNHIICPVCGTIHENSISNRYAFEMDIVTCTEELKECNRNIVIINKQIDDIKQQINEFVGKELAIASLLSKKRNEIKLKDVLISNGVNALLIKAQDDSQKLNNDIAKINKNLDNVQTKIDSYKEYSQRINEEFNRRVNIYISALSITDVTIDEEKKIGQPIKTADGSDVPKVVLAYTLAYYDLIIKNGDAVVFPLVIDTVLQQEQSTESIKNIFETLLTKIPQESQLIMATTNMHNAQFKGKKHVFSEKQALLNENDYNLSEAMFVHRLAKLSEYGVDAV